jgi:hypothetical protein
MNRTIGSIFILLFLYGCSDPVKYYAGVTSPAKGIYKSNNGNRDYIEILDSCSYLYKSLDPPNATEINGKYIFTNQKYADGTVDCRISLTGFKPKFKPVFGSKDTACFECYYYITADSYQIVIDPQIDVYNLL